MTIRDTIEAAAMTTSTTSAPAAIHATRAVVATPSVTDSSIPLILPRRSATGWCPTEQVAAESEARSCRIQEVPLETCCPHPAVEACALRLLSGYGQACPKSRYEPMSNASGYCRLVVVVMVDDSGTARDDSAPGGTDHASDLVVPGLTVQRRALDFAMQAQQMGTLEIDPSTNSLVVRTGDALVDVAWPLGWSVAIRGGEISLIDAAGRTARRLGDEVWVEGGSIDADQAKVVSCTGSKQVFVASGRFSGP
ncbi:hypothetical protein AB0E63_38615 [Kribbella sp. NPDC026596]|uniref:hypothetical protein n=1 Tax=Kribbella sp. NPDC026596 TaxID=3155122 RepID=UPI0033D6E900